MNSLYGFLPVLDLMLLGAGYALSQYIVLRSGTFSVATAGMAALGAYSAALLGKRLGVPPAAAIAAGTAVGLLAGLLLSLPLARLRGVYQAIASLAFVQVVGSLILHFDGLTGGPLGLNGIPKAVTTLHLVVAVGLVALLVANLDRNGIGRVFDGLRQDVAVAASLGVNPTSYHALALSLSGAIAGLFGALDAYRNYSLTAEQFSFTFVVGVLSYVVFGGRRSVAGPLAGAAMLVLLPELSRPLAENRMAIYGLLLIAVIAWLPLGVADSALLALQQRRQRLLRKLPSA